MKTGDLFLLPETDADAARRRKNQIDEAIERRAENIYHSLPYFGHGPRPEWVEGGNAEMQDRARKIAADTFATGKDNLPPPPPKGFRIWRLDAIILGAEGQESVLEITPLDRRQARPYGFPNAALFVPEALLRSVPRYTLAED